MQRGVAASLCVCVGGRMCAGTKTWRKVPDVFFPSPPPVYLRAQEKYGWLAEQYMQSLTPEEVRQGQKVVNKKITCAYNSNGYRTCGVFAAVPRGLCQSDQWFGFP